MRITKLALLTALTALTACGGSKSTTKAPATPAPSAYKDMNLDQRKEFMEKVVTPQMKEVFVAFDPKQFADMNCKTCHGAGAEDGTFEMPNPKLTVLPNTPEKFMEYVKDPEHARWAKFMSEQVEPKMANLLQMKPFDPATKTGEFACMNCHTLEK